MISDDEVENRTPFIHLSFIYLSIYFICTYIWDITQNNPIRRYIIKIFLPLEKESWLQKCHLKYEIYKMTLMQDWRSGLTMHFDKKFWFLNNKKLYSSTSKLSKKMFENVHEKCCHAKTRMCQKHILANSDCIPQHIFMTNRLHKF